MSLSTSIKFDGKDIRTKWGIEILDCNILDSPEQDIQYFESKTRDGGIANISTFKPREIYLTGEIINTTSHSNFLSSLDDFKKFVSGHYHGLRQFRLEFGDITDRYYMARFKSVRLKHIEPRYISMKYQIEIILVLDMPFGIYNTYTFSALVSGGSSPLSVGYSHGGAAPARPRVRILNAGGSAMTSLELINTACRHRVRNIDTTESGLIWANGRWSDIKGAIHFQAAGSLYFPCKYNFNPTTFTVGMWVYWDSTATAGYLFSTTGDIVSCKHDISGTPQITLDVNGNGASIADSVSGFTTGAWFLVVCSFNGANIRLYIYNLSTQTWHTAGISGAYYYYGLPTNFYIGTDAASGNPGNKRLDDIRIYNRVVTGFDGGSYSEGSEKDVWEAALAPLPRDRGLTAYFPFDYKTDGSGWQYTSLIITESVASNSMIEIDSANHRAFLITATPEDDPAGIMDNVSGEFPFWIPGTNGIQVVHNGAASSLYMYVEENRRFI